MLLTRSVTTGRRWLARIAGIALAAVALTIALFVSAQPASAAKDRAAAPTDPVLTASAPYTKLYGHPWYKGGGACFAEGNAAWTRATNLLEVAGLARSTSRGGGCKGKLTVRFYAGFMGFEFEVPATRVFAIPTACSTADPVCSSTARLRNYVAAAVPAEAIPYISRISVAVERR